MGKVFRKEINFCDFAWFNGLNNTIENAKYWLININP